jgi:glycosyltransferase involved in cell wall biosynthesis
MKIGIVAPIQHPIARPFRGGIESQMWFLTRALQCRGHDVTLFASGDSDPVLPVASIVDKSLLADGAYAVHPNKWIKKYRRFRINRAASMAYGRMFALINDGSFDVIHNNSLSMAPLTNSSKCKSPFVTTLHTPVFREIVKGAKYAQQHRSSKFICISHFLQTLWKNYVESEVVYNGIDLNRWEFGDDGVVGKTAIWYGRVTAQKGPHLAVMAAKAAGYNISICGPIEDEAYYHREVKPLVDGETVRYLGILDQSEIASALRSAAVAVFLPEWDEPFGLTFLETLACGTPIITFRSGAATEIIHERCGILLGRSELVDYRTVFQEAVRLSRADCRARAEFFSMEAMVTNYEKVYSDLATEVDLR